MCGVRPPRALIHRFTAGGYIAYFAVLLSNVLILAMSARGGPLGDYAAVLDDSQADPLALWVFPLFILGNLVGTFLLGLALWRARALPRWSAAAIMAWPVLHIAGLALTIEWFEVGGAALQGVAFAMVARRILRRAG